MNHDEVCLLLVRIIYKLNVYEQKVYELTPF